MWPSLRKTSLSLTMEYYCLPPKETSGFTEVPVTGRLKAENRPLFSGQGRHPGEFAVHATQALCGTTP